MLKSINANLKHYIPLLARRSRCFVRKIETLFAVVAVFGNAYNRFGMAKFKYRQRNLIGELPFSLFNFF